MFAFLHPFFMLRAIWFVKITDSDHTNQLREHNPEKYKIIEDSWHAFIMHYEYRRIELLEEELLQAMRKKLEHDVWMQNFFSLISESIKKSYSAWEESREMLIQFSHGTTGFIDLSLINKLDTLITGTCEIRSIMRRVCKAHNL